MVCVLRVQRWAGLAAAVSPQACASPTLFPACLISLLVPLLPTHSCLPSPGAWCSQAKPCGFAVEDFSRGCADLSY